MNHRRALLVDVVLGAWLLLGAALYLRQFAGPGLEFLGRLFGRH